MTVPGMHTRSDKRVHLDLNTDGTKSESWLVLLRLVLVWEQADFPGCCNQQRTQTLSLSHYVLDFALGRCTPKKKNDFAEFGVSCTVATSGLCYAWWPEPSDLIEATVNFLRLFQLQCTTMSSICPPPEMQFCHIGSNQRDTTQQQDMLDKLPQRQVCRHTGEAKLSLYSPRHIRCIPMGTMYVHGDSECTTLDT